MLSLSNIHSSYNSVAGRFKNVANWDQAKVPLNQITGEINALHQELSQHLGDLIQGFSNQRFDHSTNTAARSYKSRTLIVGGDKPRGYISGYYFRPDIPKSLTDHGIPQLQIMETKTQNKQGPEETEFTIKIGGGKRSYGASPLQYTFKAEKFGAEINEGNLHLVTVKDDKENEIQYSAQGTIDLNDSNSTQNQDTPIFSFATFDPMELPEYALKATEQPMAEYHGGRGLTKKYHRYLSEAHGWNKAFATQFH